MGVLEQYLSESEPRDIVTRSGFTWRVDGAAALEMGELLGALPLLTIPDAKDLSPEDTEKRNAEVKVRRDAIHLTCYEKYVHGLVASDGTVQKPPFERVWFVDKQDLAEEVMSRGGMGGKRAEQARRSLPEPRLLPGAGLDGEPVRDAPVVVDGVLS